MYHRNSTANGYIQSLYLPVNPFFPLLLTFHAISKAAKMTELTTRTITTATITPITVPGPLPDDMVVMPLLRMDDISAIGSGSWDDVAVMLLSRMDDISVIGSGSCDDMAVMLSSQMDDISVTDSWFEDDARWDDTALLCETLATTVVGIAAEEVIGEGGAANVIDRMELFVTSGTVYGDIEIKTKTKMKSVASQQEQWAC